MCKLRNDDTNARLFNKFTSEYICKKKYITFFNNNFDNNFTKL